MKKDLFIKIFKYIGVALIGAFVGIGALAGVSSCSYRSKPKVVSSMQNITKKYVRINPSVDSPLSADKTYYFEAKNYSTEGEGVFYQNGINLENSAICSGLSVSDSHGIFGEFTLVSNDSRVRSRLYFITALSGGNYHLSSLFIVDTNGSNSSYIYNAGSGSNGYFRRQNCAFMVTDFGGFPYQSYANVYYANIRQFFNVYDLSEYSLGYDFNTAFNFNNFYQVNDTFYAQPYSPVVGATTTNTNWVKTFNTGMFSSGGLVFDSIKVTFERNLDYYFETAPSSNEYLQFPTNVANAYNYYFLQMEYINSATNFSLTACNRTSYTKSGHSYIQFTPAWSNQGFKILHFENKISSLFIQSIFNSLSDTEQLNEPIITNNVGLSNAFSLLSMAFTAWLPIMNISIVPGITIGLLLFMPLVVGIIILVIWIVKR